MNLSLSWLADFIDPALPLPELDALLHRTGLKVEKITTSGAAIPQVVVGQILTSERHPNADRLSVCQVQTSPQESPRQIVCGAKNYRLGDKVPVALPGAVLPGNFKIKTGKLRGVESEGMMCSAKELELPGEAEGLLILAPEAAVGTPLAEVFPPQTVLELEITPNRPDWLSHLGVARELGAFLRRPLLRPVPVSRSARVLDPTAAIVEEGEACSFYSVRRISALKVGPSPAWLRQRLESIGLRPINNVVDVTNYVLHELGQPLHAFDAAKVTGPLRVRQAAAGEKFLALDRREYALQTEDLVIADDRGALALGGIMGGEASGVTESTTEVLLESAYFAPAGIRRSSRRLGLTSDSSYRFERGVDPEMVLAASERAAALIQELAGGSLSEALVIAGPWAGQPGALEAGARISPAPTPITLRHARCQNLLGVELTEETIVDALQRAGLQRQEASAEAGRSTWLAPAFRTDLSREVDLIEEVARLVGIEAVPARVVGIVHPELPSDRTWDFSSRVRRDLVRLGFFETRLSTLVGPDQLLSLQDRAVRLKNPLGEEQSWLRPSLLPGLLACARRNFHYGAPAVRLFEIGPVFSQGSPAPEQKLVLGLVACGVSASAGWMKHPVVADDFHALLGLLGSLLPGPWQAQAEEVSGWAKAARLEFDGQAIGRIGILAPAAARDLDAPADVILAEVELSLPQTDAQRPATGVRPLPKFPAVTRDLALVLDADLPYQAVAACLNQAQEPLLLRFFPIDLFSDPTGEKLPQGKKSLAVSLTFQSPERTLTTEEIEQALVRLKAVCREQIGADFREAF